MKSQKGKQKAAMIPHVRKSPIMEKHHRLPRSLGGGKSISNISVVKQTEHRAWHTLFGNKTPEEIASIINAVWLDPDFYFIVRYTNGRKT